MTATQPTDAVLPIVYTVNRDLVNFALVSIYTAAKTQIRPCHFHLVHDGDLDSSACRQIRRFVEHHGADVDFHRVPESFPREVANQSSWDVSVLFRFALTHIMPPEIRRVIYLDSDTIVRWPLDEMMTVDLGESGLGAVAEPHGANSRRGLQRDSVYLNSGVLAIDLDAWRRDQASEKMLALATNQPDRWVSATGDILAAHFDGGWTRLPPEYNVSHRFFQSSGTLPLPAADPHIIHFSGQGCKPWQSHRWHPFGDEFWTAAGVVRNAGFDLPQSPATPWYQRGPIRVYRNCRHRVRSRRRLRRENAQATRRAAIQSAQRKMIGKYATDLTVRRGPFKGMKYPQVYSHSSTLAPKLLGTYEAELHCVLEQLLEKDYRAVIDIGSAEGYYAVGAAMRWPDANVIAYELRREAREAIAEMTAANNVAERVQIKAECMFGDLCRQRALVICDIEGGEPDLLLTESVSNGLADCDFLIETHDIVQPGTCQKLHDQFTATHRVTVIDAILDDQRPLKWSLPELAELPFSEQAEVIGERRRGPTRWLLCESKNEFPIRSDIVARTRAA